MNPDSPSPALSVNQPADARSIGWPGGTNRPHRPKKRPFRLARRVNSVRRLRRHLASTCADAELAERERLAQFLHDQIGGALVQLRLAYGAWRHKAVPSPACRAAATSPSGDADSPQVVFESLLGELSSTVRRLAFTLAPPAWHDDLPSALESVAAELRMRSDLEVRLDTTALETEDAPAVAPSTRAIVCRVVRELGRNVQKHAGAHTVRIEALTFAGRLRVHVEDDGRGLPSGFAGSAQGLGLRSARAQLQALGGELALRSLHAGGTRATLSLPICHMSSKPPPATQSAHQLLQETP